MQIADVAKLPALERLLYWIQERHAIYQKKQAGKPKPWTDDEVLQSHFFTNPYRENDKVTVWLRENIRDPLKDDPRVLFAVLAFRWFNLPSTGEILAELPWQAIPGNLMWEWDTQEALVRLTEAKEQGLKIFTGAFNISNGGSTKPKINRVCEDYIGAVVEDCKHLVYRWEPDCTLAGMHSALSVLPGLGGSGFMAAQIVADLKRTYLLREAEDWWTWCSPGPGSIKGLNIILGREVEAPKPKDFLAQVNKVREEVNSRIHGKMPALCAQDIQNCLCEFSKMERARTEGYSKRRYPGHASI